MNPNMEEIQAVIQAVANGQALDQFDPSMISAAKQFSAMKANELNKMINSTSMPPNVTREMMRNELDMYQGFADKIAEDDPEYATAMDIAFIGAGLYATAKYGPMAAAKARSGFQATYGFAQNAMGNMADFASRGVEYAQTGNRPTATASAFKNAYDTSRTYAGDIGQKTHGFAKSAGSAVLKGAKRLFKMPF